MAEADPFTGAFTCWAWRHPEPIGHAGRCIGRTDLPVDRRKAKRLAHRIRQHARREGLARVVHTSPLQRCALVGRMLRSWGWRHHVHTALMEMDFGRWDGLPWASIPQSEVDAWCDDFLSARPGGGECLGDVFARVQSWRSTMRASGHPQPCIVVAHAGWMLTAQWLFTRSDRPSQPTQWPASPPYGACWCLSSDPPPQPASDKPLPPPGPGRVVPV
ncbi:MAG: hypothetical protein EKK47_12435 [Burkholderiales bacterium]|jgi:alpha-ribazole phosphatase|nr:MAG: hypothetical protein EKK47_12435 [Burkholderiales bacterium]